MKAAKSIDSRQFPVTDGASSRRLGELQDLIRRGNKQKNRP
jgi:hypothetical protein